MNSYLPIWYLCNCSPPSPKESFSKRCKLWSWNTTKRFLRQTKMELENVSKKIRKHETNKSPATKSASLGAKIHHTETDEWMNPKTHLNPIAPGPVSICVWYFFLLLENYPVELCVFQRTLVVSGNPLDVQHDCWFHVCIVPPAFCREFGTKGRGRGLSVELSCCCFLVWLHLLKVNNVSEYYLRFWRIWTEYDGVDF